MSLLKVRFDEPEHGWIGFTLSQDGEELLRCDASDIGPSFEQLVMGLSAMLDEQEERTVMWLEEPAELELHFSRHGDGVRLEVLCFENHQRSLQKPEPELVLAGTYNEICLPFWRALRALEGRYSPEELARRWKGYFPHRELALLTERLGKA